MSSTLLATYAFDSAESVVLWLTVGVVAALVITGFILFFTMEREIAFKAIKFMIWELAFYALIIGIMMLVMQLVKRTSEGYLTDNYLNSDVISYVLVPLLVLFGVMLSGAIALISVNLKKPSASKLAGIIIGAVVLCAFIAAAVTIGIYYTNHIVGDGYYDSDETTVNQTALYVSAVVLVVAAIAAAFLLDRKNKTPFDSRCIALAGITIAISFVLSYVKLWEMPQGGSITFVSLLPIMLFAYIYGPKKGLLIGFIYGIMQAMQDTYIIHPAQFLLDYPIAFAMVGFAGVFKNIIAFDKLPQIKFVLGAILAGALRFVAHVLSGVFAFGAYAIDAGQNNFWAYSLAYNSFVFVDIALVVVAGAIIFSSKAFVRQIDKYSSAKEKPAADAKNTGDNTETKNANDIEA